MLGNGNQFRFFSHRCGSNVACSDVRESIVGDWIVMILRMQNRVDSSSHIHVIARAERHQKCVVSNGDLRGGFFCFLQIRQPHTRDQRPKKALVLRLRAEYLKLRD